MAEYLTKSAARNIFYGGSLFFFAVFVALVADSVNQATHSAAAQMSEQAAHGKRVWERHACFDCHTLYGEGARFAPELGHVWEKYGGDKDPAAARDGLKEWIKSQPTRVEGRHQMPHFDLSDTDLDDLVEFLHHASTLDTQNWPPKASH